ncbi:MAG: hypothetical protein ACE5KM_14690 [Planctomycetaceae bacterium]
MTGMLGSLAALAASYAVTKVTGILGQHWWGRILLRIGKQKLQRSAAETALEKLAASRKLTDDELAKLTPEEREILNHLR